MATPANYRLYAADAGAYAASIAPSSLPQPVRSAPGTQFWVHPEQDGPRITDLFTVAGDSVSVVTADQLGFVPFYAPPEYGTLWLQPLLAADTPAGVFTAVWPADIASRVSEFEQLLADFKPTPDVIYGGTP